MNMTDQLANEFHTNGRHAVSRTLTVPLSDEGWNRIDEILECIPALPLAQLIEKSLYLAWHADDKELVA
jgi:hypothetical protein